MPTSQNTYLDQCRERWIGAINEVVGSNPPATSVWRTRDAIAEAAQPFARAVNHLLFATSGGHDVQAVAFGREAGTIVFRIREKLVYIAKVATMALEYIPESPAESFIIFELADLPPVGVYDDRERGARSEELVEITPGQFAAREVWDAGSAERDEDGDEIPLPDSARLVHRLFNGRLMMVTKGSLWNRPSWTYSGLHDRMTNDEIRSAIVDALANGEGRLEHITK